MKLHKLIFVTFGMAVGLLAMIAGEAIAQKGQYFPVFSYRTGPYAPNGIVFANGFRDYYNLLNKRDGGINGVPIFTEECETKYNTKLSIECYEKMKTRGEKGPALINPFSTGVTYALIPKAPVDRIPILSMGYGRTAAADGRVFKWIFNFPTTYWSQASAVIRYIGQEEGGLDKLRGKKITHIYHNSAYGKEANPTLEVLSDKFGFKLQLLAVDHPGQEQKATWLQIRRNRPDWVFMSGWGVMNQVAIKEAAAIRFPMDHFIGNWWSGTETDVVPAGKSAIGYKSSTFNGAGTRWQVHKDILKYIYGGDLAEAKANKFGEVLYNRALVNAMFGTEAVRTAMKKYGNEVMNGEQVRWGLENLNVTAARLKELGMENMTRPVQVSCADHETGGPVMIQQWDGKKWNMISDWIPPMRDIVRPMIMKAAAAYAKENNITPRSNCS